MANIQVITFVFIVCAYASCPGAAQFVRARVHNLPPDPAAAVPPRDNPGHNVHQESVIFGCLGIIVVLAVLCTLILWFVVERNKSDIRRLDEIMPKIAEQMRKEMITVNGDLMSGTLTASHEFETEFLTNEDVQLTSYRHRQEEQETAAAEATAPAADDVLDEAAVVTEAVVTATEEDVEVADQVEDGEASKRENEQNADQIVINKRERRSDRHNRHSYPENYHDRHSHERRSHERHSRDRRSHDHYHERYYERYPERHQERQHERHYEFDEGRPQKRHRDRHPELRHSPPDSNYINFGATPDVTLETRPPPPAYMHAYDNPGMSLQDERDYRRPSRRNGPRTAPKPEHGSTRPVSAYVTSGNEYREDHDESARPISVIGIIDDDDRWPSRYGYNSGRKYKSLLYESHV